MLSREPWTRGTRFATRAPHRPHPRRPGEPAGGIWAHWSAASCRVGVERRPKPAAWSPRRAGDGEPAAERSDERSAILLSASDEPSAAWAPSHPQLLPSSTAVTSTGRWRGTRREISGGDPMKAREPLQPRALAAATGSDRYWVLGLSAVCPMDAGELRKICEGQQRGWDQAVSSCADTRGQSQDAAP